MGKTHKRSTENYCKESPNSKHFPDPSTFHLERDGDGVYLDVNCKWCARSGCVGRFERDEIDW